MTPVASREIDEGMENMTIPAIGYKVFILRPDYS
jgi:hypothetical protein